MDPVDNPFSPGAGTRPPELSGRDPLRETVRVSIARIRKGRPAKSVIMVGLRGVGKTVLLDQMREDIETKAVLCLRIEAPESRSLPAVLAPQLRQALLKLSREEQSKDLAQRGLRALAGFVGALKIKFGDIEVGLDIEPEPGLADNGDLEHDLQELFDVVGTAAKASNRIVVLLIDELQYVEQAQLGALITALHRAAQRGLPITLIAAGLPQLLGRMGNAKSYAERLFDFPFIGALDDDAARAAIEKPIDDESAAIDAQATADILRRTQGYPYFLQEWGKQAWDAADQSPISKADVDAASNLAIAALDESFFRVRFDRLTPSERRYLRAMAELGPGPHRSGDIADMLKRKVQSLGPTRNNLIAKGMIWSPGHGDTAFTVPLFDEFMRRTMAYENQP